MSRRDVPMENLISRLAGELRPTPRYTPLRRAATGLIAGALVSLAIVLILWGPRPDMARAIGTPGFWVKTAFPFLLALVGFAAVVDLARPDGSARWPALAAALVAVVMALLAAAQLALSPRALWPTIVFGKTSGVCPWLIVALSAPIFAGSLWAMRAMAPTRLRWAGAAAGLASGAASAFVYSVSCDERTMPFIFVWYGGAIALAALVGALIGPKVLRW